MAVYKNLGPFTVGEDVSITDTVTVDGTPTGTPVNVTGWTGNFVLFARQSDAAPLYTVAFTVVSPGTSGQLNAVIPDATAATLTDRAYYFEFRRTDAGANAVVTAGWITFVGG